MTDVNNNSNQGGTSVRTVCRVVSRFQLRPVLRLCKPQREFQPRTTRFFILPSSRLVLGRLQTDPVSLESSLAPVPPSTLESWVHTTKCRQETCTRKRRLFLLPKSLLLVLSRTVSFEITKGHQSEKSGPGGVYPLNSLFS